MALISLASNVGQAPPLFGKDEISLPQTAVLIFKHPSVKSGPLYIHSGATAIQWVYHLTTQSTPTIGGEVVQILSALVGPMSIRGQVAGLKTNNTGRIDPKTEVKGWKDDGARKAFSPNDELKAIIDWFREYMTVAGTNTRGNQRRDERAIEFIYPERGWNFYIQVTKLDGFRYDRSVIAPEWSITAEVVSDNALNYFSGVTMSSFTDDLIANQELIGKIGMSAFAGSKTETDNTAFGQTGDRGSTNPFLNPELSPSASEAAKKMGDNFQGLVAAWATGDFAHFGFGALLDNGALPKNVDAAYQQLFGTTFLGSLPGNSGPGTSGTTTYGGPSNPVTKDQIILDIASTFEGVGVPGKVAVAVAAVESGGGSIERINPDARQPNGDFAMGLFQTFPTGAGGRFHKAELTQALNNKNLAVTKFYPAGMQISDASQWFAAAKNRLYPNQSLSSASNEILASFAQQAQGAGDPNYASKVQALLGDAQAAITAAQKRNPSGGAASGVRLSVIQWAEKLVAYANASGRPTYSQGGRRDVESISPGDFSALPSSDCSNSIALVYCWGTNDDKRYGTNAGHFNGSTTVTMWNTWARQEIQPAQARAGDLVIYGQSAATSTHADMLMEDYSGDQTKVFNHGSGIPHFETLGGEIAYFTPRGHPPHYFRILP